MVDNTLESTQDFLANLGLNPQEITLYLTLISHGPLSTLEIARASSIPRSTVYRLLESLKKQQLVEEIIDEHRTLSSAVPPDRLEMLLQTKRAKIQELTSLFPAVQTYLTQKIQIRNHSTSVKYYRGVKGVQQMAWNVLRTKKETVGYTQSDFSKAVGKKFAQSFYEELFLKKIFMRDIISDTYLDSIGGVKNLGKEINHPFSKNFTTRYLPNDKLKITHTMDIYNDCLAIYDWQGDDIFGVEIYNPKVASMQRQLFELLWSTATPEEKIPTTVK